ncbi:hypothetical protein OVV68_20935 [Pseudomonas aeruginosa]|nr:hypothetical protein [Pseudomonas aeruginosa]
MILCQPYKSLPVEEHQGGFEYRGVWGFLVWRLHRGGLWERSGYVEQESAGAGGYARWPAWRETWDQSASQAIFCPVLTARRISLAYTRSFQTGMTVVLLDELEVISMVVARLKAELGNACSSNDQVPVRARPQEDTPGKNNHAWAVPC